MAWRIVLQPNGKFARFSDIVDNFTHYNVTEDKILKFCKEATGDVIGKFKVSRAKDSLGRFEEELETIRFQHGVEEATYWKELLS